MGIEARKYATHRGELPCLQHIATPAIRRNFQPSMNVTTRLSLLAALPLWLASCTTGLDLVIGERNVETDEFYLAGGEPHTGRRRHRPKPEKSEWMAEARRGQYADGDYDDPICGSHARALDLKSQPLEPLYPPAWTSGISASWIWQPLRLRQWIHLVPATWARGAMEALMEWATTTWPS